MKRLRIASEAFGTILSKSTVELYGSQRKEKKRHWENFWRNYSWIHHIGKAIVNQVQEARRVPYRVNPRRNTLIHILIKLTEIKHKERILNAAREKQQVTYKRKLNYQWIFQQKLCRPEGNGRIYLKYWKRKIYNQDYYTWQRSYTKLIKSKASQTRS